MYIQANRVVNQFDFLLISNKNQTIKDKGKLKNISETANL